jgi:hypothetical protein
MEEEGSFTHAASFNPGELGGNVRLGKFEAMYEELFAEVIEDGIITEDERQQLDKMADNLGLDRGRLQRLEQALVAAYETRHRVTIVEDKSPESRLRHSLLPLEPPTDVRGQGLMRRIAELEARVRELEGELVEARARMSVDVDLSEVRPDRPTPSGRTPTVTNDVSVLERRVRQDPHDEETLHTLFAHYRDTNEVDRAHSVAHVLSFIGAARDVEKEYFETRRSKGLIQPQSSLGQDAWRRLLFHPEEEPLVGEIFSVVVSSVLVGRVSALRRDKELTPLDPDKYVDPTQSTVVSVRSMVWGASILGMNAPRIYVDPDRDALCDLVIRVPPVLRLGSKVLSGRSPKELSFLAGYFASQMREEHFVRVIIPSAKGLEHIFLAALSIGNAGMPLAAHIKEAVVPIAQAIEPMLDGSAVDRLRGSFLRFVEDGGRTNLARWTMSVDKTCARAGLLLCDDLWASKAALALLGKDSGEVVEDLLAFALSDRWAKLRRQIGIAHDT